MLGAVRKAKKRVREKPAEPQGLLKGQKYVLTEPQVDSDVSCLYLRLTESSLNAFSCKSFSGGSLVPEGGGSNRGKFVISRSNGDELEYQYTVNGITGGTALMDVIRADGTNKQLTVTNHITDKAMMDASEPVRHSASELNESKLVSSVIHLLAIHPMGKKELVSRLKSLQGVHVKNLDNVLKKHCVLQKADYHLAAEFKEFVDPNWDGYTDSERQFVIGSMEGDDDDDDDDDVSDECEAELALLNPNEPRGVGGDWPEWRATAVEPDGCDDAGFFSFGSMEVSLDRPRSEDDDDDEEGVVVVGDLNSSNGGGGGGGDQTEPKRPRLADCPGGLSLQEKIDALEDCSLRDRCNEYCRLYEYAKAASDEFQALNAAYDSAADEQEALRIEEAVRSRYMQMKAEYFPRRRRLDELHSAFVARLAATPAAADDDAPLQ